MPKKIDEADAFLRPQSNPLFERSVKLRPNEMLVIVEHYESLALILMKEADKYKDGTRTELRALARSYRERLEALKVEYFGEKK